MKNVSYWLWFVMTFGAGSERIWEIISYFQDVKKAYEAICDGQHPSLNEREKSKINSTRIEQCDSIIQYCQDNDYRIITFEDENYPPLLRNIYNPPAVLFCMGNIENFNKKPSITCVGTRKPSQYSVHVTKQICSELAARGFAIVSGFALGLDSVAHNAALVKKGCTVAVLACGIDVDYPKDNAKFKKHIAVNGAVITEYLPGTRANKYCFQYRNRILAGLCFGTLVTEADEVSGSLITAAHAAEQGRTVFCIPPGDIFDKRYSGVIKYIREGAVSVFNHLDILYDYYLNRNRNQEEFSFALPQYYGTDDIPYHNSKNVSKKKTVKTPKSTDKEKEETVQMKWQSFYDEMDDDQRTVIDYLKDGEKLPDEICEFTGMNPFNIMTIMTELEMMGVVELLQTHRYKLC